MTEEISNRDDIVYFRDITDRVEELESLLEEHGAKTNLNSDLESETTTNTDDTVDLEDETAELKILLTLLADTCGSGGDHDWRGDWYPGSMIRDTYFVEAMKDLVQDIDDLPKNIPAYLAIDWDATAENLRADYSSVDFDGQEYWYR